MKRSATVSIQSKSMPAAVRYMVSRDIREWQDCEISLPYLVVNNAEFESAVQKLEAKLAQRPYELASAFHSMSSLPLRLTSYSQAIQKRYKPAKSIALHDQKCYSLNQSLRCLF
jgi:hypothetical protein